MANHALPTTTSLYTDVLTNLKDRIDDSLKMLDSVNTSPTNVPTNSIRWNSTTTLWEKYNGSSWISLAASYAIKVLKSTNLVGGNGTTLLGSIPYQSGTDTTTLLAPNTTTTRKFLRQTGTGTNGAAPVWDTILASDIPTLNQNTTGSSGSCTGNSATATTATNVNGGTVNATTGTFSGELATATQIVIGTGGDNRRGAIYSDVNWGMFFRAKVDTPNIAHFVWIKGDGSELFRHNGTALTTNITGSSASCTGNSATATVATLAQTANLASITDVSNAVANTSFVYRTQGNLKLQTGVLGNVTLTQDMAGSLLIFNGTPTLPAPYTVRSGTCFYLLNSTTATLGIELNGNTIDTNYPFISPKETLILQSDGGTFYRVVSRSREFASNMNASAGYSYLTNGLLMQWGYGIGINIPANMGTLDITFPITFPTGVFYSNVVVVDTNVNKQISTPFCVATSKTNLHITNTDVDSPITQIRWVSIGY